MRADHSPEMGTGPHRIGPPHAHGHTRLHHCGRDCPTPSGGMPLRLRGRGWARRHSPGRSSPRERTTTRVAPLPHLAPRIHRGARLHRHRWEQSTPARRESAIPAPALPRPRTRPAEGTPPHGTNRRREKHGAKHHLSRTPHTPGRRPPPRPVETIHPCAAGIRHSGTGLPRAAATARGRRTYTRDEPPQGKERR